MTADGVHAGLQRTADADPRPLPTRVGGLRQDRLPTRDRPCAADVALARRPTS